MLTLVLLLALAALSSQQCLTTQDARFTRDIAARKQAFSAAQQAFSLDLLRELSLANPVSNVFFSPFSTYQALLVAYFGSAGETEASLQKALHIDDSQGKVLTMQAYRLQKYQQSVRDVKAAGSYELKSSNRLFLSNLLPLRSCMQQMLENDVQKLNFDRDPEGARLVVNAWVQSQTKGQITGLIPAGKITSNTELVLANAAYFKGLWQLKFQPEKTTNDLFYVSSNEMTYVSMMKQTDTFNYTVSERLGADVLKLPYQGNDVSMYLLVPSAGKTRGVDAVIDQLNPESLAEILAEDSLEPRIVHVALPKFTIEQTFELTPILEKMNVGDLFRSTSDLSGFTGLPGLSLDEAIHKAKIEVDEEGTVAAAATVITNNRLGEDPESFICNRPFLYMLYDRVSENILFMGVYRTPPNRINPNAHRISSSRRKAGNSFS